ncbi:MAG: hypothetical protein KJN62_07910, partial [Deltaproteobacteria bacterium]|nr:hypothetical protein [Deltaproteobacteria bacterium]
FDVNEIRRVEKRHLRAAGAGQQKTVKISTLFVINDITEIMKRERRPHGRLFLMTVFIRVDEDTRYTNSMYKTE